MAPSLLLWARGMCRGCRRYSPLPHTDGNYLNAVAEGMARGTMSSLSENIRRYFPFAGEEIRAVIIGVITMAFAFSFNDWGKEHFDLLFGLGNFINAAIVSTLALVVHHGAQRIAGLYVG